MCAADEYRVMLQTYLIPLCQGILPDKYIVILNDLRVAVEYLEQLPFNKKNMETAKTKFKSVITAVERCILQIHHVY